MKKSILLIAVFLMVWASQAQAVPPSSAPATTKCAPPTGKYAGGGAGRVLVANSTYARNDTVEVVSTIWFINFTGGGAGESSIGLMDASYDSSNYFYVSGIPTDYNEDGHGHSILPATIVNSSLTAASNDSSVPDYGADYTIYLDAVNGGSPYHYFDPNTCRGAFYIDQDFYSDFVYTVVNQGDSIIIHWNSAGSDWDSDTAIMGAITLDKI